MRAAGFVTVLCGAGVFWGLGGGGASNPLEAARPPAHAIAMPAYHHTGDLVMADYAGILVVDPASGQTRRLVSYCPGVLDAGCGSAFAWSPDGSRLVYSVYDGFHRAKFWDMNGIWVADASTGQRRRLASCDAESCATSLSWSPDGSLVAASVRNRVETMSPAGERVVTLAKFPGQVTAVSWSPDGRRLAVVALAEPTGGRQDLYVISNTGRVQAQLDSVPVQYWGPLPGLNLPVLASPTWAPGGRSIAYIRIGRCSQPCLNDYGSGFPGPRVRVFDISLSRAHSRHLLITSRRLGKPPSGGCACHAWWPPSLVWAPDGTRLALVSPAGLFIMSPTGDRFHRVAPSDGGNVAWQPVV